MSEAHPHRLEEYELYCRGNMRALRRSLQALRDHGLTDDQIVDTITANVPHVNRDGASWLIEDLIELQK